MMPRAVCRNYASSALNVAISVYTEVQLGSLSSLEAAVDLASPGNFTVEMFHEYQMNWSVDIDGIELMMYRTGNIAAMPGCE